LFTERIQQRKLLPGSKERTQGGPFWKPRSSTSKVYENSLNFKWEENNKFLELFSPARVSKTPLARQY